MTGLVISLLIMLGLLFGGVWIAVSLGIGGLVGLISSMGLNRALLFSAVQAWDANTGFIITAFPLFVFMGELLFESGFATSVYESARKLIRGVPGGLVQTNIVTCTLFAACSGGSAACAATLGKLSYEELEKRGYEKKIVLGSITSGASLGILIPPSTPMIIYGFLASQSVGQLFLAGVVPGILMMVIFMSFVGIRALINPTQFVNDPRISWKERLSSLKGLWQVIVLITVVLGGIYGGIATPTEVAAFAAFLGIIFCAFARRLNFNVLKTATLSTMQIASVIMFVVISAKVAAQVLIFNNIPQTMAKALMALDLGPTGVMVILILVYVILGCFLDGLAMMVLTLPFILPIISALGFSGIWFGVILVILIEIGMLTPPFGMNLFIVQGVTKEPLGMIIKGSLPFLLAQCFMIILLLVFPDIALWLPQQMFK